MNAAEAFRSSLALFSDHPLLQRLFFASVEFAVLALLVFAAIHIGRLRSPRLAALLWLMVLAKPIVSLAIGSPLPLFRMEIPTTPTAAVVPVDAVESAVPSDPGAQRLPVVAQPNENLDESIVASSTANTSPSPPIESASPAAVAQPIEPSTPWNAATILLTSWLTGAAFFASLSLLDRLRVRQLVRHAQSLDSRLTERYLAIVAQLGLKRPLALGITDRVEGPALVGTFFNTILIPAWLTENAHDGKLDWALRHELMHWKLRDPLAGLVRELALILFYFHPVAWWAGRQWKAAVERACDRAIVTCDADSLDYAEQLYRILVGIRGRSQFPLRTGLFATRTQIGQRIAALLNGPRTAPHLSALALASLTVVTAVALTVGGAFAAKEKESNREESEKTAVSASEPEPNAAKSTKVASVSDRRPETEKPASPDDAFTFAGTVTDEHGQPVADARILLQQSANAQALAEGPDQPMSDGQGRFQFSRRKSDFPDPIPGKPPSWAYASILAIKEGFGFASAPLIPFETSGRLFARLTDRQRQVYESDPGWKSTVLKLVSDDIPVRGRLLDVDGHPIVGAKVETIAVDAGRDGTLNAWIAALKDRGTDLNSAGQYLRQISHGAIASGSRNVVPTAQTNADGWFILKGLGRERVADLIVSGPKIETSLLHVFSRRGEPLKLPFDRRWPSPGGNEVYYPNEFTRVVGRSVPVEGRINDSKTGRPLVDYVVKAERIPTDSQSSFLLAGDYIQTVTDADGRYHLDGLPLGECELQVVPALGSRHIARTYKVKTIAGANSVTADTQLVSGILVRGRVTDSRTGKPVIGGLAYLPSETNPLKELAARIPVNSLSYRTDQDGKFEIPVLPGKGLLLFRASNSYDEYPRGVFADQVAGLRLAPAKEFHLFPFLTHTSNVNLNVPIDLPPDPDTLTVNLAIQSGVRVEGRVLATDGKPLSKYYFYATLSQRDSRQHPFGRWTVNDGETFQITSYFPTESRRLMFYHAPTNLVGVYDLSGEPPKKLEITLRPGAKISGRLIDQNGQPVKDALIVRRGTPYPPPAVNPAEEAQRGAILTEIDGRHVTTDQEGRFELVGIIPQLKYSADAQIPPEVHGKMRGPNFIQIFTDVTAEPGQTKQLGDLRPKPDKPETETESKVTKAISSPAGSSTSNARDETGANEAGPIRFVGQVLLPNGQPAAGATVRIKAINETARALDGGRAPRRHADEWGLLASVATDSAGRFECKGERPGRAGDLVSIRLTATMKGYGRATPVARLRNSTGPYVLQLVEDEPVRGHVLNLEGKPVVGARVEVVMICFSTTRFVDRWIAALPPNPVFPGYSGSGRDEEPPLRYPPFGNTPMYQGKWMERPPSEVVPPAKTDAAGRFEIRGLGRDRLLILTIMGPGIAATQQGVLTRAIKPLPFKIWSGLATKETQNIYGSEFEYVAAPGVAVEGTVADEDTGKPIANALVTSERLETSFMASAGLLSSATDDRGHYRIEGLRVSGENSLGVNVPSAPYLEAGGFDVPATRELRPIHCDIKLKRCLWAVGRAYDLKTGKSVVGTLSYTPFRSNENARHYSRYQDKARRDFKIGQTDVEGRFRIPVIPGGGVICLQCGWGAGDYRPGFGAADVKELAKLKPVRRSIADEVTYDFFLPSYYHAVREINPRTDAAEIRVDLPVDPGMNLTLKFVDRAGKPMSGVETYGLRAASYFGRTKTDSAVASAMSPGEPRLMWFRHKETGSAKVVNLTPAADETERTITLDPPALATGRLVGPDGQPLRDARVDWRFSNPLISVTNPLASTDHSGRFEFQIPGSEPVELLLSNPPFNWAPIRQRLAVDPGKTVDIGDMLVTFGKQNSVTITPRKPEKPATRKPDPGRTQSRGSSSNPDGANVAVAAKGAGEAIAAATPLLKDTLVADAGQGGVTKGSTERREATASKNPADILKYGDGKPDGRKSLGGTGEMIRFELPDGITKVRGLKIHGSRYGYPQAPKEDFEISFVSNDFSEILHTEHAPYSLFKRGDAKWVRVSFKEPVELPKSFWIVLNFNAEPTKGVYVSYDTSTKGRYSRIGLASDSKPREVDFGGDWMVQVMTVAPK